jgi:conjugative transfer signal peptidase TraF
MKIKRTVDFIKFSLISLSLLGVIVLYKILPYRLAYNFTNSEDIGVYLVKFVDNVAYKVGDLVVVCVPDQELANIAINRKYLSSGRCPYKTAYEIKQIAATHPTNLYIQYNQIQYNQLYVNILNKDNANLPLKSNLTIKKIPRDYYFVLGQSINSFDSRYYGLVPKSFIYGLAIPLLTWSN